MNVYRFTQLIGGVVALAGLWLLAIQVWLGFQQDEQNAAAAYNERYVEIARRIPIAVFLDNADMESAARSAGVTCEEVLRVFYDYFLLCEEQLELGVRLEKRPLKIIYKRLVSLDDQVNIWRHAITINMGLTAFGEAFEECIARLGTRTDEFTLMREFVNGH